MEADEIDDTQPERPRLLVTVAHPDDETFGTGSLIAAAATAGWSVTVLCATRGEAGSLATGCASDGRSIGNTIGEVREAELRAAAALLGADDVRLLDWSDSDMTGEPAPGTLVAAPLDAVVAAVQVAIDDLQPQLVLTLDASDGHRDHVRVRDATLLAVERATWWVDRVYLACLPQELMRAWVEEIRRSDPGAPYLALGELGTPADQITTVLDAAPVLELRQRAIRLHASQVSPYDQMPPGVRHRFLASDTLRRIRPAWNGGPIETDLFGLGVTGADSATA